LKPFHRPRRLVLPAAIRILAVFLSLSPVHAANYFYTRSAYFNLEGRGTLASGLTQLSVSGDYGDYQKRYFIIPLFFDFSLVRNVQTGVEVPIVGFRDIKRDTVEFAPVGDVQAFLEFGRDDTEYNFRDAIIIQVTYGSGQGASFDIMTNEKRSEAYSREINNKGYYPASRGNNQYALGYRLTKHIGNNSSFTFNGSYVYELLEGETFKSNFVDEFQGVIIESASNTNDTAVGKFSTSDYSFFGIENIFKKLFWTTDPENPWHDKANDHLEFSCTIDTYFDTDYYIGERRIEFGFKPFIELSYHYRFTGLSLYKSRLILVPGMWVKIGSKIRYLFGVSKILWAENDFEYDDAAQMRVLIQF